MSDKYSVFIIIPGSSSLDYRGDESGIFDSCKLDKTNHRKIK